MWEEDPRVQEDHFRLLCLLTAAGLAILFAAALWFRDWDLVVAALRIGGYIAGCLATHAALVWCVFHAIRLATRGFRTLRHRLHR